MQAVVVEVGVESGGAGGVQCPAVPRPALVYIVLGHEQVDVGGGLRGHIYSTGFLVVSQRDWATGGDGEKSVVEKKVDAIFHRRGQN